MATPLILERNTQATVREAIEGGASRERNSIRIARCTTVLYLLLTLGAPALVHWGPDVLSPTAPAIADAALDGRLALPGHPLCAAVETLAGHAPAASHCCG
jgi:hypothetical protein